VRRVRVASVQFKHDVYEWVDGPPLETIDPSNATPAESAGWYIGFTL